jgi:hypothetical protein
LDYPESASASPSPTASRSSARAGRRAGQPQPPPTTSSSAAHYSPDPIIYEDLDRLQHQVQPVLGHFDYQGDFSSQLTELSSPNWYPSVQGSSRMDYAEDSTIQWHVNPIYPMDELEPRKRCKDDSADRKNFWLNHETYLQLGFVN